MRTIGNIIWFIFAGLGLGLGWLLTGLLWSVTIVGIPVGVQCFKLAGVAFFPFNKDVTLGGGAPSLLMNILWIIFGGLTLAISSWVIGALFYITVIGIPFGNQCFKLAKLSLAPFGAQVTYK